MSITRRQLGTGPSAPSSPPSADITARLLPAERAEPETAVEQQNVAMQRGRRTLGEGIARMSEEPGQPRS